MVNGSDLNEEQMIKELREMLVVPEELPPGLAARVDIALAQEARRLSRVTWTEVLVLGCTFFLLVGSVVPVLLSPFVMLLALVAAFSYVLGIRWVMSLSAPQTLSAIEVQQ